MAIRLHLLTITADISKCFPFSVGWCQLHGGPRSRGRHQFHRWTNERRHRRGTAGASGGKTVEDAQSRSVLRSDRAARGIRIYSHKVHQNILTSSVSGKQLLMWRHRFFMLWLAVIRTSHNVKVSSGFSINSLKFRLPCGAEIGAEYSIPISILSTIFDHHDQSTHSVDSFKSIAPKAFKLSTVSRKNFRE